MKRCGNPKDFLTAGESAQIEAAIDAAEEASSAEVKLVILRHCWHDIHRKAAMVFRKLGLHKTRQRNCVLILLITTNREFLIYGDQGIHEKVGQDFWDDVRNRMASRFKSDKFGDGLAEGIRLAGEKLAQYFPHQANDKNEISDEVEYEK